ALSRVPEAETALMAISIPHWDFMDKLKVELAVDKDFQQLLKQVNEEPTAYPYFKVLDGFLFFKGKLYIPITSTFKAILLEEFHSSTLGGHSGIHKTYGRLRENVYWDAVWEDISLDFITGLPYFQTSTVILVVVDRFSKAAHFGMLPTGFTAQKVADLFAKMVFKHHGMPKSMVSVTP
ncbi:protein FAR1-RELATED SEQUENCE 5-like, partial [Trifolium medium]|nr:protein FAR1-RELATED SEQUENCE 5-like [Trifolium medium]